MIHHFLIAIVLLAIAVSPAGAVEEILLFQADISIGRDGALTVTETIRVNAQRQQIRRGIYRDFPTTFTDANGALHRNSFELLSATRDERPEHHRIEEGERFIRLYLGRKNVLLEPGTHEYRISYRTDRQIRSFDTHDELYWNVTGTEWTFPIVRAAAQVTLPGNATADGTIVFTGLYGSRDRNARATVTDDGHEVLFETTRSLASREGLTIGVKLPKGHIAPPTLGQSTKWLLRDHGAELICGIGLVLVVVYYLWAWLRVGRDPRNGVVVPRWDMPPEVSPALTHYIWNKGLKGKCFQAISAAVISLAVKGVLKLQRTGEHLRLIRTEQAEGRAALPAGEDALMQAIRGFGGQLTIMAMNGEKVEVLTQRFRNAMEREHRGVYYRFNTIYIVPGMLLTVLTATAVGLWGGLASGALAVLLAIFTGPILAALAAILVQRNASLLGKLLLVSVAILAVVILVGSGALSAAVSQVVRIPPIALAALTALLMVNLLFYFLMGAWTPLGRQRMDEIEGLRAYLALAEEERVHIAGAPEMSPQHYESLLPYAVVLDMERPWSETFRKCLTTATAAAGVESTFDYHGPIWYQRDADLVVDDISATIGSLASELSSSFTAALPSAQVSSSGFSGGGRLSGGGGFGGGSSGGGFSGGGGGGGGGGGW